MKYITTIFLQLLHSYLGFSQKPVSYKYTEVGSDIYNSCDSVTYLKTDIRVRLNGKKLTVPIEGKNPLTFIDDPEIEEYKYFGDIKGTKFSIVRMLGPNEEVYYLINRLTGVTDTLIGLPVFSTNMIDFACLNNPGTDERQLIQVCEIKNGVFRTRAYIERKPNLFFDSISCIQRNSILIKSDEEKYWTLSFIVNTYPPKLSLRSILVPTHTD